MTNSHSITFLALVIVSVVFAPAAAHNGDRVFPIRYLSEETLALLDQDDGVVEDWVDALGEPTLTPLDFYLFTDSRRTSTFGLHDPGSLDFRIWMGWTSDGRIHVAGQFVDDVYVNEYDPLDYPYLYHEVHDSVVLQVDGDHTGGKYHWAQSNGELDEAVQTNRQAQHYGNIAIAPSSGPTISLHGTTVGAWGFDEIDQPVDWMAQPPFARGGGGVFGENPTIWVTEFYVTCFDLLDHLNPENSVVSELAEGKTIGFDLGVSDYDVEPAGRYAHYEKYHEDIAEVHKGADSFVDGLLLGQDNDFEDSAVQSTSWARIKASLEIDPRNGNSFSRGD